MREYIDIIIESQTETPVNSLLRELGATTPNVMGGFYVEMGETTVEILPLKDDTAEIANIATPPEHRLAGHASKAINAVIAAADKHGVTLELGIWAGDDEDDALDNDDLRAWYKKIGFRNSGRVDSIGDPIYVRAPRTGA